MTTLPLYWNLSSAAKDERIDASVKLVSTLEEFQSQYSAPSPAEGSDSDADVSNGQNEKSNDIDATNAEDVRYAIRRLVRGLASPRESSRLGFAVALTELLSRLNTVSSAQIIALVLSSSQTQGSMQGHEIRDHLFARLFGLLSIIQSGLLFRHSTLPSSPSSNTLASTLADFQQVSNELVALGDKKSWIRESCYWALGLAIDGLDSGGLSWKAEAVEWLANKIFSIKEKEASWTLERLALAIRLQHLAPALPWKKLLAPTFKETQILSPVNLTAVGRILREAPVDIGEGDKPNNKSSSPWKPQLHYVWNVILNEYFPTEGSSRTRSSFQDFFRIAVDESLFSTTASAERKSWGFSVVEQALNSVPPSEIPLLFTQNFMRTWINHLSGQDRILHKAARQLASTVQSVAGKHPAIGFTLVLQLLGGHGNRQFDKITKTKTVESILASTNIEGVEKYISYVKEHFNSNNNNSENSDAQSIEAKRLWAIDQLASLIKNGTIPKDDKWVLSILEFFAVHGFFSISKKNTKSPVLSLHVAPEPEFSNGSKENCRKRLYTCLADLTSQVNVISGADGKNSRASGSASDGQLWVIKVLDILKVVEADTKHVKPLQRVSAEVLRLRTKASEAQNRLKIVVEERKDTVLGINLLLNSLVLQTYDPDAAVQQILEDYISSVDRLLAPTPKEKKKTPKKKRKSLNVEEAEASEPVAPIPIDEIIDIIIGLLDASTSYSRSVATTAFSFLTSEVRQSTIDHILTQLEQRDAEPDSDEEEEEEEDHDHGSHGSHSEEEDGDSDSDSDSGSNSDSDSDSQGVDGDGDDEDVDPELRRKIAEALQVSGDGDEDEGEEELMDDDQMLKMDEQLAAVFRMQQGPKADKKRSVGLQREATHFKSRVLDLIELYVRKQPASPYIVRIINPLIEAIRGARADEEQFANKATSLLQSRITKIKETPSKGEIEDIEPVLQGFNDLHSAARKAPTPGFVSLLSQASLYMARVLSRAGHTSTVVDEYLESLEDFITRKASRLNIGFFQDLIRRNSSLAWGLRDKILELCENGKGVNTYRQLQSFQLLQELVVHLREIDDAQSTNKIAFFTGCRKVIYAVLDNAIDKTDEGLTAPQLKQVLQCAVQAVRATVKDEKAREQLETIWEPATLSSIIERLQTSKRFSDSKGLHVLARSIHQIATAPSTKANGASAKRKAQTTDEPDSKPRKKTKTRKGKQETAVVESR